MQSQSPKIGPHNGKELELMLTGEKPLAVFSADGGLTPEQVGDAEFAPYVANGRIIKFVVSLYEGLVETRIYCLPGEEWRAKLCILMRQQANNPAFREAFHSDDLHRMDGYLLGYKKQDIEFFIQKLPK